MAEDVLSAPHTLEFPYTRSVGPVIGAFLDALAERRLLGARTRAGRVIVPPTEYDPDTGEDIADLVEVASSGVVTTWSWQREPREGQVFFRPFAWALIKLDGADTAMLHVVDAGSPEAMRTGMRVQVRWAGELQGDLSDIECFVPVDG
jgi:hypothetical protein